MSSKVKDELRTATCTICRQEFHFNAPASTPDPATCGRHECIARGTWSKERWAGQLRMAEARVHAGVPLNELDFDAYERAGKEVPW